MRALDTNTLVRLLVDDDARQAARVVALCERTAAAGETLFVSDVVVCELVWVLGRGYRISRDRIEGMLDALLRTRHLRFREPDRLRDALAAFGRGRGDFADYLIREHARAAGCDAVVTFDRALHGEAGFVAPD